MKMLVDEERHALPADERGRPSSSESDANDQHEEDEGGEEDQVRAETQRHEKEQTPGAQDDRLELEQSDLGMTRGRRRNDSLGADRNVTRRARRLSRQRTENTAEAEIRIPSLGNRSLGED